jgi:hypothetical protein
MRGQVLALAESVSQSHKPNTSTSWQSDGGIIEAVVNELLPQLNSN